MNNKRGFTLVEMMIVLSILTAVSAVTFGSYLELNEERKADQFIEVLAEDLYFAQQAALVNHEIVVVVFDVMNREYAIIMNNQRIYQRKVPDGMTLSGNLNIEYKSNGNLRSSAGDLVIQTSSGRYTLSVKFGKGRISIEER